ncbi:Similar to DNA-binding protein Ikaros; acc. no. O13089 [Pyronema omphalodes CBS 100304]|uniref:Similar to DNA-binding protein Ikaros acc. no. O13089 n=1 Tax=Pyronema omphalodes (strain CBS 100304) TaxID=1076935 RepID=U4LJQ6_PYROM|nr:Similar to DNA-binding protein Ikaros; acc. no. O13089 [Pyronema omphalodes CBS 100304]
MADEDQQQQPPRFPVFHRKGHTVRLDFPPTNCAWKLDDGTICNFPCERRFEFRDHLIETHGVGLTSRPHVCKDCGRGYSKPKKRGQCSHDNPNVLPISHLDWSRLEQMLLDLEAALNQVGRSDTAVDEAIAIVRKANAEDSTVGM